MALVNQIVKRESSKFIIRTEALESVERGFCPSCGLCKDDWARYYNKRKGYRISYRCCSKICTEFFYDNLVVATSYNDFRYKLTIKYE